MAHKGLLGFLGGFENASGFRVEFSIRICHRASDLGTCSNCKILGGYRFGTNARLKKG